MEKINWKELYKSMAIAFLIGAVIGASIFCVHWYLKYVRMRDKALEVSETLTRVYFDSGATEVAYNQNKLKMSELEDENLELKIKVAVRDELIVKLAEYTEFMQELADVNGLIYPELISE